MYIYSLYFIFVGHGIYVFENKYFRYEGQWEKGEKHGNYLQNKDIYFSLALNITFCYLYNQIGNGLLWKINKQKITTDMEFPFCCN